MSTPLISIIINNFNYARFLPRAIDSALSQTYPGIEVIVVDDASSDGSAELIRGYGAAIIPLLQSINAGQGAALNAGFSISRGEIVMFLDADDYLYPDAAAQVAAAWRPGTSQLHYRLDLVDAEERIIDLYPPPEVSFDTGDVVPLLLRSGRYETSVTSGNAFARAALAAILPMPGDAFRVCADGYLVTLAPFYGPVQSIEKPLGAYRQHAESNWSRVDSSDLGRIFRRSLEHDRQKYAVLAAKVAERGLQTTAEPGLRDHFHLCARISSLCLDPSQHPLASDTRFRLMLHGIGASRRARLPRARRMLLALWFMCVGLLPRPIARLAVAWRVAKSSRPRFVDKFMTSVRRAMAPRTTLNPQDPRIGPR